MNLNEGFELDSGDHEYRGDLHSEGSNVDTPIQQTVSEVVAEVEPEAVITQEDMFEEVIPGEIPELNDNFNAIAALESAFKDLLYVCDDISSIGGMNQTIALEADKCIPGFLNDNIPIGFFTKQTTATNLRYALEEIDKKKAGIIAAIIATCVAIIYKLYTWFTNKSSDGGGPLAGKSGNEIESEAEIVKQNALMIQDGVNQLNRGAVKIDDVVNDIAKKKLGRITAVIDGLSYDLLSSNSVILKKLREFFNSNGGARGLHVYLSNIIVAFESVHASAKSIVMSQEMDDYTVAASKHKQMGKSVHPAMDAVLSMLKFNGKHTALRDICTDIKATYTELKSEEKKITHFSSAVRNLDSLIDDRLVKEFSTFYDSYVVSLNTMQEMLSELQLVVDKGTFIVKDNYGGEATFRTNDKNHRAELFNAVKVLTMLERDLAEIINLMYIVLIQRPVSITRLFMNTIEGVNKHINEFIEETKDSQTPQDIKHLEDMQEFKERITEIFKKKGEGWIKV